MKKTTRPFILTQPTNEGISLVLTAVCTKCNEVVEMTTKPSRVKMANPANQSTDLQCPKCKTIYRVPAITKRGGKRRNEVRL
jgi:RNase P subunit RPR2